MKLKAIHDYFLIEPFTEEEKKLHSGIIIPKTAVERPQQGTVLVVPYKGDIRVGDVVYYKKWGGNEIKWKDKECLLVKEEDILAIIEEKK